MYAEAEEEGDADDSDVLPPFIFRDEANQWIEESAGHAGSLQIEFAPLRKTSDHSLTVSNFSSMPGRRSSCSVKEPIIIV